MLINILTAWRPKLLRSLLIGSAVTISLAYVLRLWLLHVNPVDFRYFWAAGRLWADGYNPYSDQFAALSLSRYGFDAMHRWFYAPHAWIIARPISALGFEQALTLWRGLTVTCTLLSVLLLVRAVFPEGRDRQMLAFFILLPVATVSQAFSINFSIGQFSAFSFLAVSAFVAATTGACRWLLVPALILLTMKASVALPFVTFALAMPRLRLPLVVAGVVSILLAIPGLFPGGLSVTLGLYGDAVAAYSGYAVNEPAEISGIRNIMYYWMGTDLSPIFLAVFASGLAAALGVACSRFAPDQMQLPMFLLLATVIFFVQQHTYDWLIFLGLAIGWNVGSRVVIVLAMIVTFRSNLITKMIGLPDEAVVFYGSRLVSLASLALFIYALTALLIWLFSQNALKHRGGKLRS